ncbi:MAG: GAF domain-containing protein [Deltaproteobacteria bacterium]|nr:GAF domain-containing protein [Deltaproteobacteria bacterium]
MPTRTKVTPGERTRTWPGCAPSAGSRSELRRYSPGLTENESSPPERRGHLSRKLGLAIGLLVACFAAGGAFLAYVAYGRREAETTGRSVNALSAAIAGSYEVYDPSLRRHPAISIAETLATRTDIARIEIRGHDGETRWSSQPGRAPLLATELVLPVRRPERCAACHEKEPDPIGEIRIATSQVVPFGGVSPEALSVLGLGAALLTVFVLILVERLALVRIERLSRVADRIGKGDLSTQADVDANDEIGRLGNAINRLLDRLKDRPPDEPPDAAPRREDSAVQEEIEAKTNALLEAHASQERLKGAVEELKGRLGRSEDELSRSVNRSRALHELGKIAGAGTELEPAEALDRLARLAHEKLGVPEVAVILIDDSKGGQLLVAKTYGFTPSSEAGAAANSVSGEAIATKNPVYVPDVSKPKRRVIYKKDPSGSIFAVPVIVERQPVAILHFAAARPDAFGADERDLLAAFGPIAALMLTSFDLARRVQEAERSTIREPPASLDRLDHVTGLPNREATLELISPIVPSSVILFDVPGLRTVTELLGAPATDEILRGLAEFLRSKVPVMFPIGRYGVDQFLVVLPGVAKDEAQRIARDLERSVLEAQAETGVTEPLGVVTGAATLGTDSLSTKDLPQRAALDAKRPRQAERPAESEDDLPEVDAVLMPDGDAPTDAGS